MTIRILLALALCTSVAYADEPAKEIVAKERPDCKPNGAIWVQIDYLDARAKSEQVTATLYGNGATTMTKQRGKAATTTKGQCLAPRQMAYVEGLLKGSPWKVTKPKTAVPCEENTPLSTVVRIYGKKVFTQRGCNPDVLDEKSAQALEKLKRLLPQALRQECLDNPLAADCR